MALYDYDTEVVSEQLTPPALRENKFLAWLYVLAKPIQNKWSLIFEDYKDGNVYTDYSIIATYAVQDRIRWTDKAIYECIKVTTAGILPSNTTYFVKVNDVFIGSEERVKYSAQKLLFEFALNKFFITSGIYITNNFVDTGNVFVMDTDSEESSVMPLDSLYQEDYMDLTATYATAIYDYTIFVPVAFHTSLGANADGLITNFADKYNLEGMQYDIQTY
jgi:hypothetical protein